MDKQSRLPRPPCCGAINAGNIGSKYIGGNWEYADEVQEIFEVINSMQIKEAYNVTLKEALAYKMPDE